MTNEMMKLFENMPEEMKEATRRHKAAIDRYRLANAQVRLWCDELEVADKLQKAEEANYGKVSLRWNPTTNTMDPGPQEFKP